jgi:hypothetical protein
MMSAPFDRPFDRSETPSIAYSIAYSIGTTIAFDRPSIALRQSPHTPIAIEAQSRAHSTRLRTRLRLAPPLASKASRTTNPSTAGPIRTLIVRFARTVPCVAPPRSLVLSINP